MSGEPCPPNRPSGGFTLIEVTAALLIFVLGVLMVLRLSAALTRQLEYSGVSSQLVVIAHEQIDSLEATPFDSLEATPFDSLEATPFDSLEAKTERVDFKMGANEIEYTKTVTVSLVHPLLYQIDVDVSLKDTLAWGPSYAATTYSAGIW